MEWTEEHGALQAIMRKEFTTMQKLLTNIRLEEQFILKKETQYWKQLMAERLYIQQELVNIHKDRMAAMEKLLLLAKAPYAALEALLPPQDANSWEILSMRDQMATLQDRIYLQVGRNEVLARTVKTAASRALAIETEEEHNGGREAS